MDNSSSSSNNNQAKNVGVSPHFGSPAAVNHQPQLLAQSQPQPQGAVQFPGHFQFSETQPRTMTQAEYRAQFVQLQAQAQSLAQLHSASPGVSSPSAATPSTGTAKRANNKPPMRPQGSSQVNTGPLFKNMELTPAARRKKRKASDKQIPEKVAALLPESRLYTQLLEFEARVDAALTRKKIDIQDSLKCPRLVQKMLRLYVFNTFENQPSSNPEKKGVDPPTWSLKIIGRLLEDGRDPVLAGMPQKSTVKFSSLFKKITIYLDQSLYPENQVILWESARSPALHDGFEVKRKGDKEFNAVIRLEMNYIPEKFKLSPALAEVLGIETETRPRVLAALWYYVKSRNLQNPNDPTFFTCDPPLQKIFGEEKVKFKDISQKISTHLSPPQPIHIEHRVKLSGNCPAGTTCYDILVDVPTPLEKEMSAFLASTERNKEIDACDELICASVKRIREHRRRRAFFLGFSQSPAEFINTLITSQSKDLKLVAGDASRNAEKERHSDFYNQPWVDDAVIRYLNRKSASDAPGSAYFQESDKLFRK